MEQYTNEFDMLRMRCDVVEEDEHIVARYLVGLESEISDWCNYNNITRMIMFVGLH